MTLKFATSILLPLCNLIAQLRYKTQKHRGVSKKETIVASHAGTRDQPLRTSEWEARDDS